MFQLNRTISTSSNVGKLLNLIFKKTETFFFQFNHFLGSSLNLHSFLFVPVGLLEFAPHTSDSVVSLDVAYPQTLGLPFPDSVLAFQWL